jgi:hypothetical protein
MQTAFPVCSGCFLAVSMTRGKQCIYLVAVGDCLFSKVFKIRCFRSARYLRGTLLCANIRKVHKSVLFNVLVMVRWQLLELYRRFHICSA